MKYHDLNFKDIINGNVVRKILIEYLGSSETSSASRVKYFAMFKTFVNFLTVNSLSPERNESTPNSELIARKLKLEDVNSQIDALTRGLKKKMPIEQEKNRQIEESNMFTMKKNKIYFQKQKKLLKNS